MAINLGEKTCEGCQQKFDVADITLATIEVLLRRSSWINSWVLCPYCYQIFIYEPTYEVCSKLEDDEPLDKMRYEQHGCYRY